MLNQITILRQKQVRNAPLVLLDEVEVVPPHDDGVPHLRGLHCARHDTPADGHIASERTLLVDICACTHNV